MCNLLTLQHHWDKVMWPAHILTPLLYKDNEYHVPWNSKHLLGTYNIGQFWWGIPSNKYLVSESRRFCSDDSVSCNDSSNTECCSPNLSNFSCKSSITPVFLSSDSCNFFTSDFRSSTWAKHAGIIALSYKICLVQRVSFGCVNDLTMTVTMSFVFINS